MAIRDIQKSSTKLSNPLALKVKQIPYKSPNLSPYAEGWVGTIKRECLDYFYVFGEKHLEHLINEWVDYYNTVRPHSGWIINRLIMNLRK